MDRIRAYKELLDQGAITQEEFEIKKAEILGIETIEQKITRLTAEREEAEEKLRRKIDTSRVVRRCAPVVACVLVVAAVLLGFGVKKATMYSTVDKYLGVLGDTPYKNSDDIEDAIGGTDSVLILGHEGTVDYWFLASDEEAGTVDDMTWESHEHLTAKDYAKFVEFMDGYMGEPGEKGSDPYFVSWDTPNSRGLEAYCHMEDDGTVELWWRLD